MQREIDRSGLRVKAIGLGAMPLSIAGRPEPEQAFRVIEAFVDAGGDFIDTANVYCLDDSDIGHNERLIARRPDAPRAARPGAGRHQGRAAPAARGVDRGREPRVAARVVRSRASRPWARNVITLYQLHAVDPAVDFRETLGALIALKAEGKIRHIGLSNVDPGQLETALAAHRHRLGPEPL